MTSTPGRHKPPDQFLSFSTAPTEKNSRLVLFLSREIGIFSREIDLFSREIGLFSREIGLLHDNFPGK